MLKGLLTTLASSEVENVNLIVSCGCSVSFHEILGQLIQKMHSQEE